MTVLSGAVDFPNAARTVPGDLTLNGGNVNLLSGLTVNGTIALGSDQIFTGSNVLVANGAVTRTAGYVSGNLREAGCNRNERVSDV